MLYFTDRGALRSGSTAGRWVMGLMGGRGGVVIGTAWPRHEPLSKEGGIKRML